jgi:hypothetical protein
VTAHHDPRLGPENSLFEFKGDVFPQVRAALHTSTAAARAASKGISEAEELAKDFAEILEDSSVEAGRGTRSRATNAGMTVTIVK